MVDLVHAIDVSNYQERDLTNRIRQYQAQHVVVRLSTESAGHKAHARVQLQSSLDNGCTVSVYIWSYFELDPVSHTDEASDVRAGFPLTHIWFDCETPPRVNNLDDWLSKAVDYAEKVN